MSNLWDDIDAADREGRVTWPECPECGCQVRFQRMERETEPLYPVEPLWPGGPLVVRADLTPIGQRIVNTSIYGDCGHLLDPDKTRIVVRHK